MKKVLLTVTGFIAVAILFTGVGYAASNWLNFTGDEQVEQSQNNVDEILAILDNVAEKGKIDKEQVEILTARVKELEDMNPSGLARQNSELREQVKQLNADVASKQNEIEEKNIAYDNLQQERDAIATELDNAVAERDNIQAQYNTLNEGYVQLQTELTQANEYVEHLEAELTRANNLVEEHANYTEQAVEQARSYQ